MDYIVIYQVVFFKGYFTHGCIELFKSSEQVIADGYHLSATLRLQCTNFKTEAVKLSIQYVDVMRHWDNTSKKTWNDCVDVLIAG